MKIAFVGKGGSGKSTVTALFVDYLLSKEHRVLAVDADINQHLASLLGVTFHEELAISNAIACRDIQSVLRHENSRIERDHMVKTTPPGRGSHLVQVRQGDPILASWSVPLAQAHGYFMHVGTYDKEGIGTSCYHGNLAVFENIVSHTDLGEHEWLIADMVAGTDAFAGALYLLFDAIVLVVEPTPESVGVHHQFMHLARASGVEDRVVVVANKVMDDEDIAFFERELGAIPAVSFAYDSTLKRARQQNRPIVAAAHMAACAMLEERLASMPQAKMDRLRELYALHRRYVAQDYVRTSHGDLTGQIDEAFEL